MEIPNIMMKRKDIVRKMANIVTKERRSKCMNTIACHISMPVFVIYNHNLAHGLAIHSYARGYECMASVLYISMRQRCIFFFVSCREEFDI